MNYYVWKDNAAGVKRSFKVEGEFYQQVEIDVDNEAYEKLNVPPIMNAQRSTILHDFNQVHKLQFLMYINEWHHVLDETFHLRADGGEGQAGL